MTKESGEGPEQGPTGERRPPDSEKPVEGFSFTERERSGVPAMTTRLLFLCVVVLAVLWFLRSR